MSLITDYWKELENLEYYEIPDQGFITYRIDGESTHIRDIYTKVHNKGVGKQLFDHVKKVAKDAGSKYLTGQVVPYLPGSTDRLSLMFHMGFVVCSSDNHLIFIRYDL